jgi:organic radical activating enzyme
VLKAWGRILTGYYPMLSIELTRECPLRCPGCYAYQPEHLGTIGPLRTIRDYKGQELIEGVLALVRRHRPIHVSIVGGEPLVRFRELNTILPILSKMNIEVQLVTSAAPSSEWRSTILLSNGCTPMLASRLIKVHPQGHPA